MRGSPRNRAALWHHESSTGPMPELKALPTHILIHTGNLDEVQIRDIQEKLEYFRELEDRRTTVLASISEQGKLTPELKAKIEAVLEKAELEDLYLPYKPKRRTKASIAREKGLEPLAQFLWDQTAAT